MFLLLIGTGAHAMESNSDQAVHPLTQEDDTVTLSGLLLEHLRQESGLTTTLHQMRACRSLFSDENRPPIVHFSDSDSDSDNA